MRRILSHVTDTAAVLSMAVWCLSACADAGGICARAGGTYTDGACTRSGAEEAAIKQWCEGRGAVYLAGPNTCAYGEGR